MATISENLQILKDSTDAIKQAIIDKGGTIEGDITTWASAIGGISGGGNSGGAGSVFKITNKLNGQLIGGPTWKEDYSHQYEFSGELQSATILPLSTPFPNSYGNMDEVYVMDGSLHVYHGSAGTLKDVYGSLFCIINGASLYIHTNNGTSTSSSLEPLKIMYIASDIDGNFDVDYFYVQAATIQPCFLKDTNIILSDYSTKPVQDITYNDNLLVWNFDEGKYDSAKPLWIKKTQTSSYYYKVTLDNGTILNLVGSDGKCHRLFSIEDGMFISATDMVGKTTYTLDGESKVISCELIEETVEFYNIITDYHINLFANGVLTSCRYNNIYPIKDMKFVKADDKVLHGYKNIDEYPILSKYHKGLRLDEQHEFSIEEMIAYCTRLESLKLTN